MKKKSVTDWREGSAGRMSAAEAGGPDFTSTAFRASRVQSRACACHSGANGKTRASLGLHGLPAGSHQ